MEFAYPTTLTTTPAAAIIVLTPPESGDKSGCAGYKTYPVCQGMDDLFCFLDIQYLIIAKISFVIHCVTEILMVFAGLIPSNHFFPVFVHELIDHSPILKIGCAKLKS